MQGTLQLALKCVKALNLPKSMVYLIRLEKSSGDGVRTLGDLLDYGEIGWEKMTTEDAMRNRFVHSPLKSVYDRTLLTCLIASLHSITAAGLRVFRKDA